MLNLVVHKITTVIWTVYTTMKPRWLFTRCVLC